MEVLHYYGFEKHPHVNDLISYYARDINNNEIIEIVTVGVKSSYDANLFSRFIWSMIDKMSEDCNNDKLVLGRTDNTDMLPDVEYEISSYMHNIGYIDVWEKVSDEENPE